MVEHSLQSRLTRDHSPTSLEGADESEVVGDETVHDEAVGDDRVAGVFAALAEPTSGRVREYSAEHSAYQ